MDSLVSAQWLLAHLRDPDVVICDCRFQLQDPDRGEQAYQQSHIPGSFYLHLDRDLSSPPQIHGGRHPLPSIDQLTQKLEGLGVVKNKTKVIAYDNSQGAFASRLWWLLRYFGHDQVAVLNGGWAAWQSEGFSVDNAIPPQPDSGSFVPKIQADWIISKSELEQIKDQSDVLLIDSRARDRYLGLTEPIDPIAGHIPPAINHPWNNTIDPHTGLFYDIDHLKSQWEKYLPSPNIIIYCGSGVTACVNLLALNQLGYNHAKLYVGGWSDWCSYQIQT
jgi:thiosulfate/3-mercaptopyruvate sulfurtransferase